MTEWNSIRKPWQPAIRELGRLCDQHSQEYARTGDPFHWHQYTQLRQCIERLKTWIQKQESNR